MTSSGSNGARRGVVMVVCLSLALVSIGHAQDTVSPRNGFTQTVGGMGGRIVRITSLATSGKGSLPAALAMKGPRVIVFEVGGVIDLDGKNLNISEPFVTVAAQTAPSPGITLIRGGINIGTHDVIVQHLRVRPGEAGHAKKSGWEVDGIGTVGGAYDVIVDHCSCTWATDENLSASGPRFAGNTVDDWRAGTSHRITFSNCLIAEGLGQSTHSIGDHSKGSLIHDNATDIAILGNLYASNVERNPLFKGGARGVVVNNFIVNPRSRAIHFAQIASEWGEHRPVAGQMVVLGNIMVAGLDTIKDLPLMTHSRGPLELYLRDNRSVDREGVPRPLFQSLAPNGTTNDCKQVDAPPLWPEKLRPLPVERVREAVLDNAGARPWDRDAIDRRVVEQAREGRGRIINSEKEVGGYPVVAPVRVPFKVEDWNLETMERRRTSSQKR